MLLNYRLVNLRNLKYPCSGSLAKGNSGEVIDFCQRVGLKSLVRRREWGLFKATNELPGFYLKVVENATKTQKAIEKLQKD